MLSCSRLSQRSPLVLHGSQLAGSGGTEFSYCQRAFGLKHTTRSNHTTSYHPGQTS
jgi:hypothetical protein